MTNQGRRATEAGTLPDDPRSASSLVPMLVSGLVLIVVGMIAAAALS
jgi:hypothetical protein